MTLQAQRIYNKRWYQKNKVNQNQRSKKWRENNREACRAIGRKHYHKNIEEGRLRSKQYKWDRLGIINPDGSPFTQSDYRKLYQIQQGKCKICDDVEKEQKRLAVDHDHKTGIVRGLLYAKHNRVLGWIENEKFMRKALKYTGKQFYTKWV